MLIQSGVSFLFISEYVIKSSWKFCAAFSIKDYLTGTNIAMRHSLIMHEI